MLPNGFAFPAPAGRRYCAAAAAADCFCCLSNSSRFVFGTFNRALRVGRVYAAVFPASGFQAPKRLRHTLRQNLDVRRIARVEGPGATVRRGKFLPLRTGRLSQLDAPSEEDRLHRAARPGTSASPSCRPGSSPRAAPPCSPSPWLSCRPTLFPARPRVRPLVLQEVTRAPAEFAFQDRPERRNAEVPGTSARPGVVCVSRDRKPCG